MLPKKNRLTRKEIDVLFDKKSNTPLLSLFHEGVQVFYAKAPSFKSAVSVPKKIEKSAVQRNKIRRRFFAAMREEDFFGLEYHLIFIVKSKESVKSWESICSHVKYTASRLHK